MDAPDRGEIARKLEVFIIEQLLDEVYDGRDPLTTEAVDSLGLEQLADYIEQEFGVRLADTDMVEENFESVPGLARLVESRLGSATG